MIELFGILLVCFIPGILLSIILFRDQPLIDKIILAFPLSFAIVIVGSFVLTGIGSIFATKALNSAFLSLYLILVSALLAILAALHFLKLRK